MANPIDTYRGQQGLAADTGGYHPDPQLVTWIKLASKQTGADPVALMATALQESGGVLNGKPGDVASGYASWGPFQLREKVGALGKHSHAWASTYAAVLNRAQEFAKYRVRGGRGAAAVQRPANQQLYAQGVDSLLEKAHAIMGGVSAPPGAAGPRSANPAAPARKIRAQSSIQDALDILDAGSTQEADDAFAARGRMITLPGTPARPDSTPVSAGAPGPTLTPGGGWAGTKALADSMKQLGLGSGLSVMSEKRTRKNTASGGVSDHWTGSTNAYAYDLSNGSNPTPQMDAAALRIASALGAAAQWKQQGSQGVLNVTQGGYRYQMLYRTKVGGNHFNHVHIGVRKL